MWASWLALLIWSTDSSAGLADTFYDDLFRGYSELHLPGHDWRWVKAQAYQESRYNPVAVSPAGAVGLMQVMPATGRQLARVTGVDGPLTSPAINVLYGVTYDRMMFDFWTTARPPDEHRKWAQASYNAGAGNILKAQKLSGGRLLWDEVALYLPRVTGHHSKETIQYVQLISKWYQLLVKEEVQ